MLKISKNLKIAQNKIFILAFIFVISGLFGFLYETIFYRIDLGYFIKRGTTFGPWIPIYGFGGVLIFLMTSKFQQRPWKVFLISSIVCGLLEFLTGFLLFHISGLRLWNYHEEIWNWGNIDGFICFRSVFFFGLSGVFLMNIILPQIQKMLKKDLNKILYFIVLILCFYFLLILLYVIS